VFEEGQTEGKGLPKPFVGQFLDDWVRESVL
jgi:hypothetical protein